ncbi:MAG: UvrD-helicase domain-containing protein, partial [Burkholderiales bacterium]|nr:UvrD-helicase domain-containing protein [Phycisphaerae bacterium]
MTRNWTTEQRAAIETHDRNLLVSAAAGSGKTAVLAERFAYLVCDAPDPCDVDQILVVTFTNDAAAEMRKRISQAIAARAAAAPSDQRLQRQAMLINTAQISTIHGMASGILRRHFHELGLDPNFRLLNDDEARLMRNDVAIELLDTRFDDAAAINFRAVVGAYCNGRPAAMKDLILATHAKLSSLVDSADWLQTRRALLQSAADAPLVESALGRQLIEQHSQKLRTIADSTARLIRLIRRLPEAAPYVAHVQTMESMIADWLVLLRSGDWDALRTQICPTFETLPTIKGKSSDAAALQKRIDALKKNIKGFVEDGLFCLDEETLRIDLKRTLAVTDEIAELVHKFDEEYRRRKSDEGVLDFNDLERLALQLLRDPESPAPAASKVAIEYQQQYRHLMVDEYQDVNELQDTILTLLSGGGRHFAVGDVKQSIYRFRQADPRCFLQRRARYADPSGSAGQVIDLQKNFRSRAPLLATLNAIFARLMTSDTAEIEYDASQRLIPGLDFTESPEQFVGQPVELHIVEKPARGGHPGAELESTEREALLVARRIREMLGLDGSTRARVADRGGESRPIDARDIVILLRSAQVKAERFASVLRRAGIPVQADSKTGFFEATEVSDLIYTLQLLDNARNDIALATFLRSPLSGWDCPEDRMAEIRFAYPHHTAVCFHQALATYESERHDPLADQIRATGVTLRRWREVAQTRSVADLLWTILEETSYLSFISGLPDGQQRVANVLSLHERAREFAVFQRPTIPRFVEFLK